MVWLRVSLFLNVQNINKRQYYRYGFINLFPQDNPDKDKTKVSHIDIEEAVLPFGNLSLAYHMRGDHCRREENENVVCREPDCGVKIWTARFKSYSTVEEEQAIYKLNNNRRKEKLLSTAYLSLVAKFSGEVKLLLHRDGEEEGSHFRVAWLDKKESRTFDDSPQVNKLRLQEAWQISSTTVPKNPGHEEREKVNEEAAGEDVEVEDEVQQEDFVPEAVSTPEKQDGRSNANRLSDSTTASQFIDEYLGSTIEKGTRRKDEDEDEDGECSNWSARLTECGICRFKGRIANHLRGSRACLEHLRAKPQFQFSGGDDAAVIKISMIIGECPNPTCNSGRHIVMPQRCVEWWKQEGGILLGWKGLSEDFDANVANEKIRKFIRNWHFRQGHQEANQRLSNPTQANSKPTECVSCCQKGPLIPHLQNSDECLGAYVDHLLPDSQIQESEEVQKRRLLFQIAAIVNLCANPLCPEREGYLYTYLGVHLNKSPVCHKFYQEEGGFLGFNNWGQDVPARIVSKRVSAMKRILTERKWKEDQRGSAQFQQELSQILNHYCSNCGIMGPVPGEEVSKMTCIGENEHGIQLWQCVKCLGSDQTFLELVDNLKTEAQRLNGAGDPAQSEFALLRDEGKDRAVFTPSGSAHNYQEGETSPSWSTAILVPYQPAALKMIKQMCDRAVEQRADLSQLGASLLSRPIVMDFQETFSILYQHLLANTGQTMKQIYFGLSSVAQGQILPENMTTAKKKTPKQWMTFSGALRESCLWSAPSEEKISAEQEARNTINGMVKMYLKATVVDGFKDADLNRVLLVGCKAYLNINVQSIEEIQNDPDVDLILTKMSPIILKFVNAKVGLFVKHIIDPNFSNYDLRLKFNKGKLNVHVEGFVYARQFIEVNQMISRDATLEITPEVIEKVLECKEVLPTVTLDWNELTENFNIEEARAKHIIEVVLAKQLHHEVEAAPLSLLNIWTPPGCNPTEGENILRGRLLDLCRRNHASESTTKAIVDITLTLREEGLFEELLMEQIDAKIRNHFMAEIRELLPESDSEAAAAAALTWYHCLLFRTGAENGWTLRRKCGEQKVAPYHPLFIEALKEKVEVRISVSKEPLKAAVEDPNTDSGRGTFANFAWKEVSILEFLQGVAKYENLTSQGTIGIVSSQEEDRLFRNSNEQDEEVDDVFVNRHQESYIIINGDKRKQYSKRPPCMDSMIFAQYVVNYYRLERGRKAVIDPQTDIGGDSDEPIIGGEGRCPLFMRLSNKIVVKKRVDKSKFVPLLLKSSTLDNYSERMLFSAWRNLDELVNDATDEQKLMMEANRLAVFPTSCFPKM